jgi:hypothetical protein
LVYTEEDIQASGGSRAIERIAEKESYWFVRLGVILVAKLIAKGSGTQTPSFPSWLGHRPQTPGNWKAKSWFPQTRTR